MISLDSFLKNVQESINYVQIENKEVPYIIIDENTMLCPFCGKKIKNIKNLCKCQESRDFVEILSIKLKEMKNLQKEIDRLKNIAYKSAISVHQGIFKKEGMVAVQEMIDSLKRETSNIINYKEV